MEIESYPAETKPKNRLAQASAFCTGTGWVLLFSFVFSDELLDLASSGSSQAANIICVAPVFAVATLCLLAGIVTGHVALRQIRPGGKGVFESARKVLRYGYAGIAFVLLGPFLDAFLSRFGFGFANITDFFGH